jgi:hypothetical protein
MIGDIQTYKTRGDKTIYGNKSWWMTGQGRVRVRKYLRALIVDFVQRGGRML